MVKTLHGKNYYLEFGCDEWDLCDSIFTEIADSTVLKDEVFYVQKIDNNYVIYSNAQCGSFRGPKYHEWERIKAKAYRLKRARRA